MTEIWMDYTTMIRAQEEGGRLIITGNRQLEADLGSWLKLSHFAKVEKRVA